MSTAISATFTTLHLDANQELVVRNVEESVKAAKDIGGDYFGTVAVSDVAVDEKTGELFIRSAAILDSAADAGQDRVSVDIDSGSGEVKVTVDLRDLKGGFRARSFSSFRIYWPGFGSQDSTKVDEIEIVGAPFDPEQYGPEPKLVRHANYV